MTFLEIVPQAKNIVGNIDQSALDVSWNSLKTYFKISSTAYLRIINPEHNGSYKETYLRYLGICTYLFCTTWKKRKKLAHSPLSSQFLIRDAIYR